VVGALIRRARSAALSLRVIVISRCDAAAELRPGLGHGRGRSRTLSWAGPPPGPSPQAAVLTTTGWPVCTVKARRGAAGDAGSGPGVAMSLLRTIWPLERAIARSRVGWTSQPFRMVVLTSLVCGGAGPLPDRRRHALVETGFLCLPHISLSSYTRQPWFTGQSNKALTTAPFAKVICRRPKP
jgi:hypothetical protein